MHIRLPRWPTVDFRPGRELTFALPLCANSHKDSLLSSFSRSPRNCCVSPSFSHSLFLSLRSTPRLVSSFFSANFSFVSRRRVRQCIEKRVEVSRKISECVYRDINLFPLSSILSKLMTIKSSDFRNKVFSN